MVERLSNQEIFAKLTELIQPVDSVSFMQSNSLKLKYCNTIVFWVSHFINKIK